MIPDEATVDGLLMLVVPDGCGSKWVSAAPGDEHPLPGGGPVAGESEVPAPSHTAGMGSTESDPWPAGKVTVWMSLIVVVVHFTVSPEAICTLVGSISAISTPWTAVPAVMVIVCVPF